MNRKVFNTLEFNKIIERLEGFASSDGGKKACKNLVPMTNIEQIKEELIKTDDALSRIYQKGSISFSGVYDITASLKRLEIGSILGMGELLKVAKLLVAANRVKAFSRREKEDDEADSLDIYFEQIEPLTPLANEINRCIISEDEMADDASPTLHNIRRSMNSINDKIHSQMTSLAASSSMQTYLQDNVVTMRNGRYCLPVKAEYRSQVPGMIHDQSSTGSTLFVEPMAVVKLNNDLKELMLKEQEEIEVILANLSNEVSGYTHVLTEDYRLLTMLDFIFAKAAYAKDYKGSKPEFNTNGIIELKDARHPLLDKHKCVPITINLGRKFDLLVVTGPNTGGKTVSLKTTGLLTLMGQAGMLIPAFEGSKLAVFKEVFADIGDEQSIEQNLSTFSSHMTNIVNILKHADKNSLCLFDELCAGTDPTEGAALAISILTELHNRNARIMATTHYSELKIYALSTPRVENASCEFSVETLSPTYRILIGVPGKSNAFAISSKLGLSNDIIENAKAQISAEDETFEDLIANLENSRITIEKEQAQIESYKEEIERLKKHLETKEDRIDQRREDILRKANEEANRILAEAKEIADKTIRDFHKFGKENINISKMEDERRKVREQMNKTEKGMAMKTPAAKQKQHKPTDFHIGDSVRVLSMNVKGSVLALPDAKGMVMLQMGILRSKLPMSDLEIIPDESTQVKLKNPRTNTGKIKMSKSSSVSAEINLLGLTVDEAISRLDKYLDDAYLAHLEQVRVVHGKGTGALRAGIHQYLKRQKHVKSYRLGAFGEGDAGVTIVEFK